MTNNYFQVFYKGQVNIIHKDYKKEFEEWLDWHRTSIGFLVNRGLEKEVFH